MFLVIAVISAVLGLTGIAGTAVWLAKVLFVVGLVTFLILLLVGSVRRPLP